MRESDKRYGRSTCLALAVLVTLLAADCRGPAPSPPRHLVLITLDTLRADHLGCYGNDRVRTPEIDALARRSVRFREVASAAPTTLASHVSILTGTYPRAHGVLRNGFLVHPDNEMLAEVLARNGFHTGAVVGSSALDSRFGIDQGFDSYDEEFDIEFDGRTVDQSQRRAGAVTDGALAWLDRAPDSPWFLFVHYFDAHAPYSPPAPYDRLYTAADGPHTSGFGDIERAIGTHQERIVQPAPGFRGVIVDGLDRRLLEGADGQPLDGDRTLADLYAGEVSYVSAEVGRLLDGLDRCGALDDAVVVLTADHGEAFWEHADYWNHGLWVYQTTVRVPLIVRLPDSSTAGRIVDTPVSLVDVMPTVLDLLGLPAPPAVEGRSLIPALRGQTFDPGAVFSEATQPVGAVETGQRWGNARKAKAVREGRWKYVWCPYLGLEQMFDLEQDPGERRDLLADPTPGVAERRDRLRGELDAWSAARTPYPSRFNPVQDEELMQRLRSLGYVGGGTTK